MGNSGTFIVVWALAAGLACGQPAGETAPEPSTRPSERTLRLKHLRIDRARRRVVVQAAVSLRRGALEFLLCKEGTKDYESLLTTQAAPSSLHAALLALGLAPGLPAQWAAPAGGKPVFVPPKGAMLQIELRWKGADGRRRQVPATDWMVVASTGKRPPPTRWVFVGSDLLDDGRYWADVEGHHVSVANFGSSVIDVPFESSDQTALLEFASNAEAVPAKGTPVEVVITPVAGAETAPHARMSFDVDRLGRIRLDGAPIGMERVGEAAREFLSRHSKATAEVRLDPRALVYDRERLDRALSGAGLTNVVFRMRPATEEILPRTSPQAVEALAWWRDQFARAKELLVDPAEDAEAVLKHIQVRRKQIEELSELWADYFARLRRLVEDHRSRQAE